MKLYKIKKQIKVKFIIYLKEISLDPREVIILKTHFYEWFSVFISTIKIHKAIKNLKPKLEINKQNNLKLKKLVNNRYLL